MKVGDIVRCYYKGYWRVVEIEPRVYTRDLLRISHVEIEPDVWEHRYDKGEIIHTGDPYSPLAHLKQVARADLKPVSQSRIDICDAAWCRVVTEEEIDELMARYVRGGEALKWWIRGGDSD